MPSPNPPALDISGPEPWSQAYGAISDALTAIAFAHPACARAELRLAQADGSLSARVENMRRARRGSFELDPAAEPAQSREAARAGMPASAAAQADSLSELLGCLGREASSRLSGRPDFATALGPTLGLGLSERWDADHDDGIDRSGEGLQAFEAALLSAADSFPASAMAAARAACRFLSGPAQSCAQSALAEIEAEGLRQDQGGLEPAPRRASRSL